MACGCFDDTKVVAGKHLILYIICLDAYYKQYYPCLSAAAATIKWYSQNFG
jgi:DNA mismatch repair protein MSH4